MATSILAFTSALAVTCVASIAVPALLLGHRWRPAALLVLCGLLGALVGYWLPSNNGEFFAIRGRLADFLIELTSQEARALIGGGVGQLVGVLAAAAFAKRTPRVYWPLSLTWRFSGPRGSGRAISCLGGPRPLSFGVGRRWRMTENKPNENLLIATWVDGDGKVRREYAPYPADERWAGVYVDSSGFKQLSHPERLYKMSQGFLASAIHLCEQAGDSGEAIEWPQASVCRYLLHLATEQFLKACVLRLDTQPTAMNHDISGLRRKYYELLPNPEFDWPTPWHISAQDIDDALGFKALHGIDRLPDQLYRYGADKSGAPSAGLQVFAPSAEMGYMRYLKERWTEIWAGIAAKADVQQCAPPDAG